MTPDIRQILLQVVIGNMLRQAAIEKQWPPHRRKSTPQRLHSGVKPPPTSIRQARRAAAKGTLARLTSIDQSTQPWYRRDMARALGVERIDRVVA